jgi:hypothetical protein
VSYSYLAGKKRGGLFGGKEERGAPFLTGVENTGLSILLHFQELGYNIWIDTEQMKENILQAMAQGIEDCAIFLMCMSESYKESPNARTGML